MTQRTRNNRRKKKKPLPGALIILAPLLLGILVTPFAVRGASVLALSGPSALRLLYPFVVLVQSHAQTFATSQEETLAQWVMYGQFPVYGLVWMLTRQFVRGSAGPLSVVLLHCVGVAAAILTASS